MKRLLLALSIAMSAGMLVGAAPPATPAPPPVPGSLILRPCTVGPKVPAQCGTFTVYEDRAAKSGAVTMALTILKATHPGKIAIAELAGGPGEAATDTALPMAAALFNKWVMKLHDTHDVIFLDARGMGKYGFACDWVNVHDPASYMRQLFPDASVQTCLKKSASRNRALYNGSIATDDLEELRTKLGYDKYVLDGGSYGTFLALVYMRRHPGSVAAAILDGVDAPGFQALPGTPDGVQHTVDDTLRACAADKSCAAHYPNAKADFSAVVARFSHGPVVLSFNDPVNGKVISAPTSKEVFVDRLRQLMYDPHGAAAVPYIMHEARTGNTIPLGDALAGASVAFSQALNLGAFLSYSCSEWIPFLDETRVRSAASASFAGDLRIGAQRAACAAWNVPSMPANFDTPVTSDIPALLITGSDDPATPPWSAQQELPYLHNGRQVVVKGGGHGNESPCIDALVVTFVQKLSANGLDVDHCSVPHAQLPFYTTMPPWLKP